MSPYAHPAGPRHAEVLPEGHPPSAPQDLNELSSQIWPLTARRDHGAVSIGGVDVTQLARQFGTPLFVVDEEDFRTRAREFRSAFAGSDVYYAGKALLTTAIARWVHEEGLNLDVCSGGELTVAQAAGFPPARIGMHGNNKSETELERALDAGVGRIVVDSLAEIDRLERLAEERGVIARIQLRVTTGVEAHTHEFVATAHDDQKFGLAMSNGAAMAGVRRILAGENIALMGLHSHIGSQIFDTAGFEVAARRLAGFLTRIHAECGIVLPELNLGGGLGIAYTPDDTPLDTASIAKRLTEIVARECADHELPTPRLAVEPGRGIAGRSGVTVYQVGTVKNVEGLRTYVSVDGGMSDNIRTALYGADYTSVLASRTSSGPAMLSRLVGKHCESGDIIVRDLHFPDDVTAGDLVAVAGTGAYCYSMSNNYNHLPRPALVAVRDGEARLVMRRETEEDLLRLDVS